jgi:hypothetical protein
MVAASIGTRQWCRAGARRGRHSQPKFRDPEEKASDPVWQIG